MIEQAEKIVVSFEDSPDYVQSLHRGLDVICAFDAEHASMTLSEVAERAGQARAVTRRLLMTLEHLGYVCRRERQFSLAPRVLDLGLSYLSSFSVATLALPFMEELAREIQESCSLCVLEGHDIVYVQRVTIRKVMTINLAIGTRLPAFCASMGRVLVAALSEEARADWLRRLRPQPRTAFAMIDKVMLQKELQRVVAQGYAYVEQEMEEGLCSVAVPVRDRAGVVIAALNVAMPFRSGARARATKEILPPLRAAAERIEENLPGEARSLVRGNML